MNEESLFAAALEKNTPEERTAFLDMACGADESLRARVLLLLEADARARGVLERVPVAGQATAFVPPPSEQAGTVIGPYKLIEQIGEGGMGSVWMAQQTAPVKR